jgi:hypothetical protein
MRASLHKTSKETIFSSKIPSSIPRFFQGILQDTSIFAINPWVFSPQVTRNSPETPGPPKPWEQRCHAQVPSGARKLVLGSKNEGICFKRGWGDVVNTGKLTDRGVRCPPFDAFVNVRRLDFEHCSMFPKQRLGSRKIQWLGGSDLELWVFIFPNIMGS